MDATRLGHWMFSVSFVALGLLSLGSGDFALVWQPVPQGVPLREPLAYASGLLLLACGVALLLPRPRIARWAAAVMTVNLSIWLLLLRLPPLLAKPGVELMWLGFGETTLLVTGSWILLARLAAREAATAEGVRAAATAGAVGAAGAGAAAPGRLSGWTGDGGVRWARRCFGAALLMVGPSHFIYLQATAGMIPGWIPWHSFFAYFTGAAHVAAGLAILCGIAALLAARLEAVMISLFTALVCIPMIVAAPATRMPWTAFFISAAMAGAAWIVAGSLPARQARA